MNAARLCLAFALITVARLAAQTATLPAIAAASNPEVGFVSMFDGASLIGWDGDPKYWRVENGVIVGEITPETIVKRNTFLIWRGGTPANFELKVDYRVSDRGNSGINYRSVELTDAAWSLAGYQATSTARANTRARTTRNAAEPFSRDAARWWSSMPRENPRSSPRSAIPRRSRPSSKPATSGTAIT